MVNMNDMEYLLMEMNEMGYRLKEMIRRIMAWGKWMRQTIWPEGNESDGFWSEGNEW